MKIKHRKAELAHERGGLLASFGQTIAGPRFYETDDVCILYLGFIRGKLTLYPVVR